MTDSPVLAPLTPADCNLQDFPFMPVDIARLFNSEFHARATDAEWRAAVTLWLKAYHQVPAASVPDDDVALARLAEFGRDTRGWRKVREIALYGWVKCSDGRLYHRIVAAKALEAWIEKLAQRRKSGAGNAKRWGGEFDPAAIDDQIRSSLESLKDLDPSSRTLLRRHALLPPGDSHGDAPRTPTGNPTGTPTGNPRDGETESQGTGTEKGQGQGSISSSSKTSGTSSSPAGDELLQPVDNSGQPEAAIPPCDHQAVLALWRQHLPTCPQPSKWTDTRRKHLQARWRELFAEGKAKTRDEALAWFSKFFRYLAQSRFLTGRVAPRDPNRSAFFAELPWVLLPENFVQCIEGKYHPEA
jgi:hypothetical protein